MRQETAFKILDVQEAFHNDPEFEDLWAEHQLLAGRYLEVMNSLPIEQAGAIEDFFGIINEIHLRTLICALK